MPQVDEEKAIEERYARRTRSYSLTDPSVLLNIQEREREIARWARNHLQQPLSECRLLEVGCGTGANLLQFLRFGFSPENLVGNELLPQRLEFARRVLPPGIELLGGNAASLDLPDGSFDVVFQSMVFSSILDDRLSADLAQKMWQLVRPGGGVLWYDFTFNNPSNPDVRGVPRRIVEKLFPSAEASWTRVTLAPPLARAACRVSPKLYALLNLAPVLRTHLLAWLHKPR